MRYFLFAYLLLMPPQLWGQNNYINTCYSPLGVFDCAQINGFSWENSYETKPSAPFDSRRCQGISHNTDWIGIIGTGSQMNMSILVDECSDDFGLQVGVGDLWNVTERPQSYYDCRYLIWPIDCETRCSGKTSRHLEWYGELGRIYVIYLDGCTGDVCRYQLYSNCTYGPGVCPNGISLDSIKGISIPDTVCVGYELLIDYDPTCCDGLFCSPEVFWRVNDTLVSRQNNMSHNLLKEGLNRIELTLIIGMPYATPFFTPTIIDSLTYTSFIYVKPQENRLGLDTTNLCLPNPRFEPAPDFSCQQYWEDGHTNANRRFTQTGTYIYNTICRDSNFCQDEKKNIVIVGDSNIYHIDTVICQGDTIVVNNEKHWKSTMRYFLADFNSKCDSFIQLQLTVIDTITNTIDTSFCEGDSIEIDSFVFYQSIDSVVFLGNGPNGCPQYMSYQIREDTPTTRSLDTLICSGDSIQWEGLWIKNDTTWMVTEKSQESGCIEFITHYTVQQNTPIRLDSFDIQPNSGMADGQIFVQGNGGLGTLKYFWNEGQTGQLLDNLNQGTYCLSIIDSIGCYFDTCFQVNLETYNHSHAISIIEVFPNPLHPSQELFIHGINKESATSLRLINLEGREINIKVLPTSYGCQLILNTATPPGIYSLEFSTDRNYRFIKRLIIL